MAGFHAGFQADFDLSTYFLPSLPARDNDEQSIFCMHLLSATDLDDDHLSLRSTLALYFNTVKGKKR